MVLMRDRKEMTLNVMLEDEDRSEWFWQQDIAPAARPRAVNPLQQ